MLVPQVDEFGNELGGIPNVEIAVPLATYTPWSLRAGLPGQQQELRDFYGAWLPLAKNQGDGRKAVTQLYEDKAAYMKRANEAAWQLVDQGYLLDEDVARVLNRAERTWDWVMR